ncbi:hypothetical protein WJX73_002537 [Symbiochloris irregularis]|uniref:U3 small nucleolar RNA-associated protein 15 C-terminal domain-containing protein n=1 Tax=Symbiochloris irregularis TaxID=706552 RepID=A0AAW1NZ32_9CHLO
MEYEPAEYRKLVIKQYPPRALRETPEGRYWRRFKAPVLAQQIGAVTSLDFTGIEPYKCAVTSSTRVLIYNAATRKLQAQLTRFKDKAYSGTFRADGRLIVAGSETGHVQVFDVASRGLLRQLKGHAGAVHTTRFAPDRLHVLSGGDDSTVRWWDITAGEQVASMQGHSDYVRSAICSPTSPSTWLTGGYDHTCKLWDVRSSQCILTLQHEHPIEAVTFFPSGGLAVTAGGPQVCVWDLLGGGRLLHRLASHQKTVTCLAMSPVAGPASEAAAPRLLSGSLDGHVKVYELDGMKVTHASCYPAPVLSLALSPDCSLMAVGMADGLLSLRKHANPRPSVQSTGAAAQTKARKKPRLTAANFRYFVRGASERATAGDSVVAAQRGVRLQPYDKLLRKFRYREALDAALETRDAAVVASLVEELAARKGLNAALGGRDSAALEPLLRHLQRHLCDSRHTRLLVGIGHRLLDMYGGVVGLAPSVDAALQSLSARVGAEMEACRDLEQLQGILEALLTASLPSSHPEQRALGNGPAVPEQQGAPLLLQEPTSSAL